MNLDNYYTLKTIQKSNRFRVTFTNDIRNNNPTLDEPLPQLQDYHIVSVNIPNWEFKKEVLKAGPYTRSFPVLDGDGFELTIVFEEDADHTIAKMIDWMQRKIIISDGFYNAPNRACIKNIQVEILTDDGKLEAYYDFPYAYILRVGNVSMDYTSNDSVKHEVVFGVDIMKKEFTYIV